MAWTEPRTWVPGEFPGATEFNAHVRDNLRAILPVGSLIYRVANFTSVETVVENRFLECNGVAVSRSTYAALFAHFNSLTPALPFGVGNGTTTFNLPDTRGRTLVNAGTHADVTLGGNDAIAEAARSPRHAHVLHYSNFTGNAGSIVAPLSAKDSTSEAPILTVGAYRSGPTEAPAHLVGGVWYIKYTS